jgi:hypothetical protein
MSHCKNRKKQPATIAKIERKSGKVIKYHLMNLYILKHKQNKMQQEAHKLISS